MNIQVTVTQPELDEMGLTEDELHEVVLDALDQRAEGPNGKHMSLSGFTVSIDVMPTKAEFAAKVRASFASRS